MAARADLLVIDETDLGPYVDVEYQMVADATAARVVRTSRSYNAAPSEPPLVREISILAGQRVIITPLIRTLGQTRRDLHRML